MIRTAAQSYLVKQVVTNTMKTATLIQKQELCYTSAPPSEELRLSQESRAHEFISQGHHVGISLMIILRARVKNKKGG